MADRIISDLIGTLRAYFKVKTVRLKDSSGVLEVKNSDDSAYAQANASQIGVAGSNASNKVAIQAPAGLSGNVTFCLPGSNGTAGYFLQTDGNGVLSYAAAAANGILTKEVDFSEASSSPLSLFTPPENSYIERIVVVVSSAASGGSPTICIGVSGTTGRDMATTENDLKAAGVYETKPMTAVGGSPAEMIATIVPASQTFTGKIMIEYTVPA